MIGSWKQITWGVGETCHFFLKLVWVDTLSIVGDWCFPGLLHKNNSFILCIDCSVVSQRISTLQPILCWCVIGQNLPRIWGRFCHLTHILSVVVWYSSCYHQMPPRASLGDRKNISFTVIISYEENNSQIWFRHSIFLFSMHNGIFDGTLTVGVIGGEPYCEFSNPVASALKPFWNPHSYCVFSYPIHWVTKPAPLDENRKVSFFIGKLCYSVRTQ